jgi:hypothetical protein
MLIHSTKYSLGRGRRVVSCRNESGTICLRLGDKERKGLNLRYFLGLAEITNDQTMNTVLNHYRNEGRLYREDGCLV